MAPVKTTIEMPDKMFRQVKALAASRGISLKSFFTEALHEKLAQAASPAADALSPWMEGFGGIPDT